MTDSQENSEDYIPVNSYNERLSENNEPYAENDDNYDHDQNQ